MAKAKAKTTPVGVNPDRLKAFLNRIEELNKEIGDLTSARADVYDEAQKAGFVPRVMRRMISQRGMTEETRQRWLDDEETLRKYCAAIGYTPLEALAAEREEAENDEGQGEGAHLQ